MTAWIFQCNPDRYNLPGALGASSVERWLANQHRSEIKARDTAYLWETGPQSGILAVATILSEPAIMPPGPDNSRFGSDDLSGDKWRVRLKVDKVLTSRLLKTDLIKHPVLLTLPNIRFPNATNFKLSSEEASALANVVAESGADLENGEEQPQALTQEDFEVLARHRAALPWNEISSEDQAAISQLREKLLAYATDAADRLNLRTRLAPFVSLKNPNGRNALYYWCCVYPKEAKDKSYGFQLFLIVHPTHVELGFGAGAGTGGRVANQQELKQSFEAAKQRFLALKGTEIVNSVLDAAAKEGLGPRSRWLGAPNEAVLASTDAWIVHATSPEGNGAAFSAFWLREQVIQLGVGFRDRLEAIFSLFTPLLDAIYEPTISEPKTPPPPEQRVSIQWLISKTSWPEQRLRDVIDAVQQTQVILAGPPGTGKTWIAKAIATYMTNGAADRVTMVQLHPSYTYEQFIEGLRPIVKPSGGIDFQRADGIVLRAAKIDIKRTRIIVMDEMNRANLPRVLGELMYLFEYRNEAIALQYSPRFSLPHDLRFIGTMNTADRSIRSIDIALRRRFDVFECKPDPAILAEWYNRHENSVPDLLGGFVRLNEDLEREIDRHHTIGHTFFMADTLNPKRLATIWARKIGPLLEEYFFDRPDLAAGFELNQYWPSVVAGED